MLAFLGKSHNCNGTKASQATPGVLWTSACHIFQDNTSLNIATANNPLPLLLYPRDEKDPFFSFSEHRALAYLAEGRLNKKHTSEVRDSILPLGALGTYFFLKPFAYHFSVLLVKIKCSIWSHVLILQGRKGKVETAPRLPREDLFTFQNKGFSLRRRRRRRGWRKRKWTHVPAAISI